MLLAVCTLVFFLGFLTAVLTKTNSTEASGHSKVFFGNLRRVLDVLKLGKSLRDDALRSTDKESNCDGVALLRRDEVEQKYPQDSWQHQAYDEFTTTILGRREEGKTFPCIYATKGFRSGEHRYIFLNSDDPSEPYNVRVLGPALRKYLSIAEGDNASLVIICAPSEQVTTVAEYNQRFWQLLRGLRVSDLKEWPSKIPSKTDDKDWTFCYEGQPIFPIALTPAHQQRRSRQFPNFIIAIQPKWVLDNLMSTEEKRKSATGKVRKLLKEYDEIEISPDLTTYGAPGTTESKQLTLDDENKPSECPFEDFD